MCDPQARSSLHLVGIPLRQKTHLPLSHIRSLQVLLKVDNQADYPSLFAGGVHSFE